jgi:hypothetical protein
MPKSRETGTSRTISRTSSLRHTVGIRLAIGSRENTGAIAPPMSLEGSLGRWVTSAGKFEACWKKRSRASFCWPCFGARGRCIATAFFAAGFGRRSARRCTTSRYSGRTSVIGVGRAKATRSRTAGRLTVGTAATATDATGTTAVTARGAVTVGTTDTIRVIGTTTSS